MKKEYFANIEYNRQKRRKALTLSLIAFILFGGMASVFFATKTYIIGAMFLLGLIIPITALPSAFKNHPIKNEPIITFDGDSIILDKVTLKIKEISSIKVTIDLPPYEVTRLDFDAIEELKNRKPEDLYFGAFDIFVKNEKKNIKPYYTTIDHVIDALETAISLGLKKYAIFFVIKNNAIKSNYDMISLVKEKQKEEFSKSSKQSKTRQLI